MTRQSQGAEGGAGSGRLAVGDPEALAELRVDIFQTVGPEFGGGILYGIGFAEGQVDALRLTRGFQVGGSLQPRFAGPRLPLLFAPAGGKLGARFTGSLTPSVEAGAHRARFPAADDPICFLSAGYAAGWYTELLGEKVLVRERTCVASGADRCTFEARRLEDWLEHADPWINELLPYLDFEGLHARALKAVPQLELDDAEGEMLGSFDPMSPAMHVWGPVMVLPYGGALHGESSLEAIRADIGDEQIRVVVVDLTGARIEALERAGLARLIDHLESLHLEPILAGLNHDAESAIRRAGQSLGTPLIARSISEGIALGFQLCAASTGSH